MTLPTLEPAQSAAELQAIDVDLHHELRDWAAIAPYVAPGLRWRVSRAGGPPLARHGFRMVGARFGSAPTPTADGEAKPAHPASDPAWIKQHYLDARGVDIAILTGSLLSLGVQPNADLAAALASAINQWTLETWVRPYPCYRGSILVAQQDPPQAVAEIDRLGDDPGMVQVLMGSASEAPLGRRMYHPIYAACVAHQLPLALHIGGEGAGVSPPATAVGHPTTYFEWYGSLPQSYMGHIMSMVTEGVFERFPMLKVVLYDAGVFWVPHLMWRFDKNWKAQRSETPWVTQAPSRYIQEHFYLTTYPLEAASDPKYLHQVLDMIDGQRRLLFSSSFPNWALGDPFDMIRDVPESMKRQVMVENALAVYGDRLLAR
jgi:predicted TIM-barrel fold metal-dependent hydrolase